MKTEFTSAQLTDPNTAGSHAAIRNCVHCGFCTSTCPTYVLLGDELDSPRGRIYLIKNMLENDRTPSASVVKHIDRCLSCLSCMTTCPSDVNYMHLIDHARAHVARRYKRPWHDRMLRAVLGWTIPHPKRFRASLRLAFFARPFKDLLAHAGAESIAAMLHLAPRGIDRAKPTVHMQPDRPIGRVAIVEGCVGSVLRAETGAATQRLAQRLGFATCESPSEVCCGALSLHMGEEQKCLEFARQNVDAWDQQIEAGGLDAIISTVSGCGSILKQYGRLLAGDKQYAEKAKRVSSLVKDVSEWLHETGPPPLTPKNLRVAYQSACSLQHGQHVVDAPLALLRAAGFDVALPAEPHLCCGSAGVYNILQPAIAARLRTRKLDHIGQLRADLIATGNIGCTTHMQVDATIPIVHVAELLDWAAGGPPPSGLADLVGKANTK